MKVVFLPNNDILTKRMVVELIAFCKAAAVEPHVLYANRTPPTSEDPDLKKYSELEYFDPAAEVGYDRDGFYRAVCARSGVSYRHLSGYNKPDSLAAFAEIDPDLVFTLRIGTKIGPALIAALQGGSRKRLVNLHPGPLPALRGLHSILRSFQNGAAAHAYTLHEIDADFDTGRIISSKEFGLDASLSALRNLLESWRCGVELIKAHISDIRSGDVPASTVQPANSGAYFSAADSSVVKALHSRGVRLSDEDDLLAWEDGWALRN